MPFDVESAREAGRKSGESRRRAKDPDAAARDALLRGVSDSVDVIVRIARGTSGFDDVKPELRFKAALTVLEYAWGKPKGNLAPDESEDEPEDAFAALLGGDDGEPAS